MEPGRPGVPVLGHGLQDGTAERLLCVLHHDDDSQRLRGAGRVARSCRVPGPAEGYAGAQAKEHKPSAIFVEDAASGQSVVQSLRRETRLPVLPVKPVGDKVLRANRVTGTVEAKKVTLPRTAPWLQAFREELAAFPNGVHDDQVDAFVGCLTQLMQRAGRVSIAAPILVEMRD